MLKLSFPLLFDVRRVFWPTNCQNTKPQMIKWGPQVPILVYKFCICKLWAFYIIGSWSSKLRKILVLQSETEVFLVKLASKQCQKCSRPFIVEPPRCKMSFKNFKRRSTKSLRFLCARYVSIIKINICSLEGFCWKGTT